MKAGAPEHPKMQDLTEFLGIPEGYAVGLIELLFHFTNQYTPRGDVGRFTDRQIERRLKWDGDDGALVAGLREAGWLDDHEAHRFVVHDWPEHAPDYTKRKANGTKSKTGESEGWGWAVDDTTAPTPKPEAPFGPPETSETQEDCDNQSQSTDDSGAAQNPPDLSGLPTLSYPVPTPTNPRDVRSCVDSPDGDPPSLPGVDPPKAPDPPQPTPTARAKALWPRLREAAARHNDKRWREKPSKPRISRLAILLSSGGLSEDELIQVIDGAVAFWGKGSEKFDPHKALNFETLYRDCNWPKYLEAYAEPQKSDPITLEQMRAERATREAASAAS